MDLEKEILKEHSKRQTSKIVDYVGDDPGRFKRLVHVFLTGPYRVTQRAGWPISCCVEVYPNLIVPHFNSILKMLNKKGVHDAVKRNIVRLLQFVEIPARFRGKAAASCFNLLGDPKESIAVRCFSMTVLANITKYEPDFKKELKIIIEDQLPYASAGFTSRARKVLKEL